MNYCARILYAKTCTPHQLFGLPQRTRSFSITKGVFSEEFHQFIHRINGQIGRIMQGQNNHPFWLEYTVEFL